LALDEARTRVHLLDSYEAHVARHPSDAALCLSRRGLVLAASSAATRSLRVALRDARGRPLGALPGIRLGPGLADFASISDARPVELRRGDERLTGELRPIARGDEIDGFLLEIGSP